MIGIFTSSTQVVPDKRPLNGCCCWNLHLVPVFVETWPTATNAAWSVYLPVTTTTCANRYPVWGMKEPCIGWEPGSPQGKG